MASIGWPNWADVEVMVKDKKYVAGNDTFNTFKKKVVAANSEEGLKEQASHAPLMWDFLVGFAACKAMYRRQIIQVFNKLMEIPEWVQAWESQTELHSRIRELHVDLQAALGLQSAILQRAISPSALKSMSLVKQDERPEQIRVDMKKDILVDKIQEGSELPFDAFSNEVFEFQPAEAEASSASTTAAAPAVAAVPLELAALQDGIDEATAIVTDRKMDSDGKRALQKLRVSCIRCAGREDFFVQESGRSHQVFHFLLSYVRRKPEEVSHVAEVMNQLMASPSWAATLQASQLLKDELRQLPVAAQASLGVQHEKVMELISSEARKQATSGTLKDAEEVAEVMKSIRLAPSSGPAGTIVTPSPPPPPAGEEWKEARTADGHRYYFNIRTRQSSWERPESLGGPLVYKVGDEVEIWSNSQKVWGRGTVKKVEKTTVTAEFTLPNGQMAQKELPAKHKDLRPYDAEGWTEQEQTQYRQWFMALPRAPSNTELRKGAGVADFLRLSGLPREALVQAWAVGNPNSKEDLDFEAFARCCRLVAHCQQLLAAGGEGARLVSEAERPLRSKLRTECLPARPPNGLATFDAPAKMGKGQGASVVGGGRGR